MQKIDQNKSDQHKRFKRKSCSNRQSAVILVGGVAKSSYNFYSD